MILINGQNLNVYYGAQLILEHVTFEINQTDRVGLTGRNGSGKSTLLRLIAKLQQPDGGQLTIRKGLQIGYLAQIPADWEHSSVYDVLASGYQDLIDCRVQMTVLEQRMAEPQYASSPELLNALLDQYAELQQHYEQDGGYEIDARIDQVASGLQIGREFYGRTYATLSGGEKTKIGLASQLIRKPELLLLDEPTNHLDLPAIEWLENYLNGYTGTFVVVSHDRYFLDRVVTKIIELEDREAFSYSANYTAYLKLKEEQLLLQFAQYKEQQKKIKAIKETIKKLEEWGRVGDNEKFFKRAASMQKALDRMEKLKRPVLERRAAAFDLQPLDRSGRIVLALEHIRKSYGERLILKDSSGVLEYGETIVLIGGNGSGKSTLLRLVMDEEQADSGSVKLGARVEIGYMAQQETPRERKQTVLAFFRETARLEEGEARSLLAGYLFYGADVFKSVGQLSGGEWARLRLALIVQQKPNVLLLDEPTNHMDIASKEALEDALWQFPGTILAISHDRYFINRLADKIWELDNGQIRVWLGNFDAYMEHKQALAAANGEGNRSIGAAAGKTFRQTAGGNPVHQQAAGNSARQSTDSNSARQSADSQAALPALKRTAKQQPHVLEQLEQQIAQLEASLRELAERLQQQELASDAPKLAAVWAEHESAQAQLDSLLAQWLLLQPESGA